MTNTQIALLMVGVFLLVAFFMFLLIAGVRAAYKNGVRDGYQNTWLPHVQNQIREQGLQQGEEVKHVVA